MYDSSSDEELRTYDDSSYCNLTVLTEDKIEDASDDEDTMSDDKGCDGFAFLQDDVVCSNQEKPALPSDGYY